MPYKNKEDRTDAVRRHRAKKKGIVTVKDDATLGDLLESLGFKCVPLSEFVEWCKEPRTGRGRDDILVYWGGVRTMVVMDDDL